MELVEPRQTARDQGHGAVSADGVGITAAVAALKALANPARLRIALHLTDGEAGVGEIETQFGIRQPILSQCLAELRDAGLVTARREARHVFYALADARAEALLRALSSRPPARPLRSAHSPHRSPLAAASFASVGPLR